MTPAWSSSFLVEYMTAMGKSKVPEVFHWWSAMSLLAACVGDRMWVEHAGRRVRPNLYILLLGDSGIGKGAAISAAAELGAEALGGDLFYGRTTPEGLRDRLQVVAPRVDGRPARRVSNPRIWLLMEELAFCVGQERGTEFVSTLVATYGGAPVPIRDRTRTGGEVVISGSVCVNFLAGTTKEWLQRTLTSDDLAGGFSRRLVVVAGQRSQQRFAEPEYPSDRQERLAELRRRCLQVSQQAGALVVEPEAREAFAEWYLGRPAFDDDPGMLPWWDTQDELVYKVATLLAVSDGPPWVLTRRHMEYAQAMTNQLRTWVAEAVVFSSATPEARKLAYLRSAVRTTGLISRRTLQQRAAGQGVLKGELDRYVSTMLEMGDIRAIPMGGRSGVWYQWISTDRAVPKLEAPLSEPLPEEPAD
jgi:hypothetical protein